MTIVVGIPGAQGIPGQAGAAGAAGTNGNTVWPTTGAPSASLGVNGDFANDSTNSVMYGPKANGAWPSGVSYKGSTGPQGVPGANARWVTGTTYTGLVATRCKAPNEGGGSTLQHMARSIHVARTNITQLGAAFANWYITNGAETPTNGTATIQASVEYPLGGTIYPLTFSGLTSGVAADFTTLASDLVSVSIPSGAQFAIREYRVCSAGGGITYNVNGTSIVVDTLDGECYTFGSSVSNLVNTPGAFTSTSTPFNRPVAVFGPTNVPSYALLGDSRAEGFGDNYNGNLDVGELARSVGPTRAYTNLAFSGELAKQLVGGTDDAASFGAAFSQRSAIIRRWCTHVLSNYGVNDLFSGNVSANGVIGYLTTLRNYFPKMYWYQTIPMGETTSTDSWATTTNQTLVNSGYETNRRWLANYFRSGMVAQFDGVFDTASALESAQNTGIWKAPGYTADGVHATQAGYAAIVTAGVISVA